LDLHTQERMQIQHHDPSGHRRARRPPEKARRHDQQRAFPGKPEAQWA
jgi:hypothetical protein